VQHPFQLCQQKEIYVLSVLVICWQETSVAVKKRCFTPACLRELFLIKSSFEAMVQPEFY